MSKYLLLFISIVSIFGTFAQEIRSSLKTKRLNEVKVHFRDYHEDLIITDLSSAFIGGKVSHKYKGYTIGKLRIYKGEEMLVKKFNPLFLGARGKKYARSLIFKEDRMGILNTYVNRDKKISLFIKDYDYDLKNPGDQVEVLKADLEIDEKNTGFGGNLIQQITDIHYDKVSKTSLVELYVDNSNQRSFLTLMVLGENYEEIARVTIPARDHEKYVQLVKYRILESGEVLTVIKEQDGYGDIHSYNLLHIATDGSNNHRIMPIPPVKERIIQSEISKNSYQDNIIVSVFSTDLDRKGDEGKVTAYKYNLKSGKIDNKTYTLKRSDVASAYKNDMEMLGKSEIHFLEDGSTLYSLLGDGQTDVGYKDKNIVVFKVDKNGEFQWVNKIERFARSSAKERLTGYLYYFNGEGDLEIIFNSSKSAFRKGTYAPRLKGKEDYYKASSFVRPTKAKVNLETGEMEIYRIDLPSDINSFSFSNAREMDENGVYKIRHFKGTDSYISIVDFKD